MKAPKRHSAIFAARPAAAQPVASDAPFRVGRRVPRNVYRGDHPLFMAATEAEAAELVALLNLGRSALKHGGGDA